MAVSCAAEASLRPVVTPTCLGCSLAASPVWNLFLCWCWSPEGLCLSGRVGFKNSDWGAVGVGGRSHSHLAIPSLGVHCLVPRGLAWLLRSLGHYLRDRRPWSLSDSRKVAAELPLSLTFSLHAPCRIQFSVSAPSAWGSSAPQLSLQLGVYSQFLITRNMLLLPERPQEFPDCLHYIPPEHPHPTLG